MSFTFSTLRGVYITNTPYQYPLPWLKQKSTPSVEDIAGDFFPIINTGWHILPNFLWGHVASPKQWWEMVLKYEAIRVESITCRLFNPIPIQTAVSFQGTGTFPAFNNTVYAWGYSDELYETPWFNWYSNPWIDSTKQVNLYYEYNPAYKEGLVPTKRTAGPFPEANSACNDLSDLQKKTFSNPKEWTTSETQGSFDNNLLQKNSYRRIFLPIYWYNNPFKQYRNIHTATASWINLSTNFDYSYNDVSGAFWDPLNRPDKLMELRPGKNMIEFHWEVHPSDSHIWFNTDRIGFIPPYHRPQELQPPHPRMNAATNVHSTDPLDPGCSTYKYNALKNYNLVQADTAVTVGKASMAPETQLGRPNWRPFPIVPSRWFLKEMQQSNPWTYKNYDQIVAKQQSGTTINCDSVDWDTGNRFMHRGDYRQIAPCPDLSFPGTEYEMHKYPPTQWFTKTIPLYDDTEKLIKVEMQVFMYLEVKVSGKERHSALYAPSWGPVEPMDLYSVNMDTNFGENFIRGRSGGARRTWYNIDASDPRMPSRNELFIWPHDLTDQENMTHVPVDADYVCKKNPSQAVAFYKTREITYNAVRNSVTATIENEYARSSSNVN